MGFSKLLLSARSLNGVGYYQVARRLLASEAGQKPCNTEASVSGGVELVYKKAVVYGVYKDEKGNFELSEEAKKMDAKVKGKLLQNLTPVTASKDFKVGKAILVTDVDEYNVAALTCVGPKDAAYNELEGIDEGAENARWGVGAAVQELKPLGSFDIHFDKSVTHQQAMGEAANLALWSFENFKHWDGKLGCTAQTDDFATGQILGDAQNWARYLSDMPANKMTPTDLAQEAINKLCGLGVTLHPRDKAWIEHNNMQAFLTVARGSCEPPIFLECEYKGDPKSNNVILVAGKGVTFDSGGLCLKKRWDMAENRGSMAGAAAALGAIYALATLKIKINVAAVFPLCENMISGQCMRVGDVVRALNGVSILIEDTDMEGRLMLADALIYGQAKYKPSVVIDVATLTHGIKMATGGGCYGCFTNQEYLWDCAHLAGIDSGDRPWRFPLWKYFEEQITNNPAVDLRNRGSGKATPAQGAAFLKNFVCTNWIHFDVTGVGKLAHDPPPYLCKQRMSGRPTRAIFHTLQNIVHHTETLADCNKQC